MSAPTLDPRENPDPLDAWEYLQSLPGFNERLKEGQAQLDRGERVPFERPGRLSRLLGRLRRTHR